MMFRIPFWRVRNVNIFNTLSSLPACCPFSCSKPLISVRLSGNKQRKDDIWLSFALVRLVSISGKIFSWECPRNRNCFWSEKISETYSMYAFQAGEPLETLRIRLEFEIVFVVILLLVILQKMRKQTCYLITQLHPISTLYAVDWLQT